jgi:hypothetical protein
MLELTLLSLALTSLVVATYVARNSAELGWNALLLLAAMLLPLLIVVLDLLELIW